ncbi:UPF0271 protein [Allopseudospirillum japonicum]|uniref:UPF0271 protein n=1 Tax=Allopseudospirillum japonicum TaxID=64971 RepID=A0A1H6T8K8_9GAMM|nr:5-oxoprolinase subunit PxpA [Allopseudospirillum japonicum]SEI72620.1 UPF0271 protein [Allopseudospirillum japonicum]
MKLNADLGESFGAWQQSQDVALFPYIDQANLACGFHAADPITMQASVTQAVAHQVQIGAHPGYPDLVGFGRRSLACSPDEIYALILYQLGALEAFCRAAGTCVAYVKPHGALYTDMMHQPTVFTAICQALADYAQKSQHPPLPLMVLSQPDNTQARTLAAPYQIPLLWEVFADRQYQADGSLTPRTQAHACHTQVEQVLTQVQALVQKRRFAGMASALEADSLCIHGDHPHAVLFAQAIRQYLQQAL